MWGEGELSIPTWNEEAIDTLMFVVRRAFFCNGAGAVSR